MQKRLIFLSMVLCSYLVYLSENARTLTPLDATSKTQHNILLDLNSKTDKVIYDNLIFSSYNCNKLSPTKALCSQFSTLNTPSSFSGEDLTIHTFKNVNGENLKTYTLSNGEAHIELSSKSSNTLHKYSFTSIEKADLFTNQKSFFKKYTLIKPKDKTL